MVLEYIMILKEKPLVLGKKKEFENWINKKSKK